MQRRSSSGDPDDFRLTLVEHLDELRFRLIRAAIAVLIGWVIGWFIHDPVYSNLSEHLRTLLPKDLEYQEAFRNVVDAFFLKLKLSFTFGLVLALPIVITQVWGFIKPGLKPSEQKPFRVVGPVSIGLFFLGCYFCWIVLPPTMAWFGDFIQQSYKGVAVIQEPGSLVFFAINMMLGFGLGFQLPLVIYFLAAIGLLPPSALKKYWRQAVVVIFIVAAVATPSADPFSMMMMAIPLCVLFVLSVLAVNVTHRKKLRQREEPTLLD